MSNVEVAMMMLDSLILGVETNSMFPVQLSELKTIKILPTKKDKVQFNQTVELKEIEQKAPALQPTLRAVRMSLFPEMETLQSAVELANSQLPITNTNAMLGVLMTYHNTLIKEINRGS